ncbi:MAG: hypothetical protein CMJ31_10250 [Phycisphaerae bacterium]|nr:hypothetical protein [Phycisphaerae bacterium]
MFRHLAVAAAFANGRRARSVDLSDKVAAEAAGETTIVVDIRRQPKEALAMVSKLQAGRESGLAPVVMLAPRALRPAVMRRLESVGVVAVISEFEFSVEALLADADHAEELMAARRRGAASRVGTTKTAAKAGSGDSGARPSERAELVSLSGEAPGAVEAGAEDVATDDRADHVTSVEQRSDGVEGVIVGGASGQQTTFSREESMEIVRGFAENSALAPNVQYALKLCRDSSSSAEDLAAAIKRDQALAVKVLQMANSAVYRRGRAVSTVEQAIVRVGFGAVREAIMSVSIIEQFNCTGDGLPSPLAFWEHSFAVATIASGLAQGGDACSPEDAFLIGLLHDIGRIVMADRFGSAYTRAIDIAEERGVAPEQVERELFEVDHADVAGEILRLWEFPEEVVRPVWYHHLSKENVRHLDSEQADTTRLLQTADRLAKLALLGDGGSDWIRPSEPVKNGDEGEVERARTVVQRACDSVLDVRSTLGALLQGSLGTDLVTEMQARIGARAHARFFTRSRGGHPYRWLANRLAPEKEKSENLAIVHADSAKDLEAIAKDLEQLDARRQGRATPVLVLKSTPGEVSLGSLGDRPAAQFAAPFRVSEVVDGIGELLQTAAEPSAAAA